MRPRVSVVVPSYHRPALLERCLAALARQDFPAADYELVVVHDGPSEPARRLVAEWGRRFDRDGGPALRYVEPEHGGPAAARNAGWRAAAAEIVAFTDDDTLPDPSWLRCALDAFSADVDAAWGAIVVPLPPNPTDYEVDAARLARGQFVTANCFCRKPILEAVGGFDERFELAWREDSDLFFRLLDCDARVVHVPDALVVHPVRTASWGVSLFQQRKVLYDALLFKKHRKLYRQWIRPTPRWDYYAIVAALGATALAAASGAVAVAAPAAVLWLLLTGRFCIARLRPATKRAPHIAEMIVTSVLIPPIAVFWRMVGALRFRVVFL
ncbi:MAG TPA: glycosyltransferase [Gammaproteobacteria bacterium]